MKMLILAVLLVGLAAAQNFPRPPVRPNIPQRIEHPDYLNCPEVDVPGRVVYFPYHRNCANFYQCINGRAIL